MPPPPEVAVPCGQPGSSNAVPWKSPQAALRAVPDCVCCGGIIDEEEECQVCGLHPLCRTCHRQGEHNCPRSRVWRRELGSQELRAEPAASSCGTALVEARRPAASAIGTASPPSPDPEIPQVAWELALQWCLAHPLGRRGRPWCVRDHFHFCGQSCPCCRFLAGDRGGCPICRDACALIAVSRATRRCSHGAWA